MMLILKNVWKKLKIQEKKRKAAYGTWFYFPRFYGKLYFATHQRVPAKTIFEELKKRNIYVRYFNKPRIDNYLRISIGTDAQMQALYAALKEIVNA